MTMAAAIDSRTAQAGHWSKASRLAAVDIVTDLGQAEAVWRELESRHLTHTPYQRFDFLAAWQRQVGAREGAAPCIAVAYDAERRPLALLPLASFRKYGVHVASFMGGKHATFNMALWDRDFAASASASRHGRADGRHRATFQRRRAGAVPAAADLARRAEPDGAAAAPALGQ